MLKGAVSHIGYGLVSNAGTIWLRFNAHTRTAEAISPRPRGQERRTAVCVDRRLPVKMNYYAVHSQNTVTWALSNAMSNLSLYTDHYEPAFMLCEASTERLFYDTIGHEVSIKLSADCHCGRSFPHPTLWTVGFHRAARADTTDHLSPSLRPLIYCEQMEPVRVNKFQRAKNKGKELIANFQQVFSRSSSPGPSRNTPNPELRNVLSVVKNVASGLKPVLELTKEVSDAFPPLKGVVSGILAVWKVYDVGTNTHLRY